MDMLAALRGRTQQAEVFTVTDEATAVSFEANEIKSVTTEETQGIALRALVNGRLGFTAASGVVVEPELIDNLLASAQFGDELEIAFPEPQPAEAVHVYDPELQNVPIDRLVDVGREIIAALRAVDDNAQIGVEIERSVSRSTLRNSAGALVQNESSSLSVSISVERVRGDDVFMTWDEVEDISLTTGYRQAVERLAERLERAKRPAKLTSGRWPVLFSPTGAALLGLPVLLGINGENVLRGTSPLSQRLGEAVFDPQITIWDDPTLPQRPGSSSYDDEGVPCRRKALIQEGVAASFVYDLKTAALMHTVSTGNGSRSLFSAPEPSPSNLVFAAGDRPLGDILAGIERGLLVESVLGLGQGNAISGAFSNTVGLAYVIERGEIVGRVKDVSIAGNIYQDLKQVAAISRESFWVYGQMLMPWVLLPELNVVCQGSGGD